MASHVNPNEMRSIFNFCRVPRTLFVLYCLLIARLILICLLLLSLLLCCILCSLVVPMGSAGIVFASLLRCVIFGSPGGHYLWLFLRARLFQLVLSQTHVDCGL